MFGSAKGAAQGKAACKDYGACSGCSLCLLVCPVWRQTHDPRMTPEGRAKALQHGATAQDIAASVQACRLCGACEPVCPEGIDLVGMTLDLRARLVDTGMAADRRASMLETASRRLAPVGASVAFLPGPALRAKPEVLRRVCELLGAGPSADDGMDLLEAFAAGVPVPRERKDRLIAHLGGAQTIVFEDGLWLRLLREWLPKARLASLGESLSSLDAVRRGLRKTDLYVIEPRGFHGDYERLVKHYDRLKTERGCALNLDLQRIAIPPAGQAGWVLKGLKVDRIVVERQEDAEAFSGPGHPSVVHLAELADH